MWKKQWQQHTQANTPGCNHDLSQGREVSTLKGQKKNSVHILMHIYLFIWWA